ncbi:PREDICTED: late embryogenesis abundant protein 32-like [Tarenaya hassleriana]|uniref:late embryogenesis abundant protein 32-like n=1 Tax=Tarenaya hassleriana TaxID=28532 RepID=UPI0008FD7F67|nr:PREDICTED: late embryogenesis abundant protein 32-like [Tarenaya hassleriana]
MAQKQPQRPRDEDLRPHEPIKYGDVFNVSGELAGKPVSPRDAATVQAAETAMMGKTLKGGPASVMQSAANFNVGAGLLSPDHDSEDVARQKGVSFSQSEDRGRS